MDRRTLIGGSIAVFGLAACAQNAPAQTAAPAPATPPDPENTLILEIPGGRVVIQMLPDLAPQTVARIKTLARQGFYDNTPFHRVIEGFMAQTGDPTGTGMGGPGYKFEDEVKTGLKHEKAGIFSMANAGPGTNGSQFFITHVPTPHLDGKHTVFGEVTKGQDVVNSIAQGDKIEKIEILDSTDALFEAEKARIAVWNKSLK